MEGGGGSFQRTGPPHCAWELHHLRSPGVAGASPPVASTGPAHWDAGESVLAPDAPGSQEGPGRLVTCPEAPSSVSPACLSPLWDLLCWAKTGLGLSPDDPDPPSTFLSFNFLTILGARRAKIKGPAGLVADEGSLPGHR